VTGEGERGVKCEFWFFWGGEKVFLTTPHAKSDLKSTMVLAGVLHYRAAQARSSKIKSGV
jgi:hypothetical protein